jgi:hypothetical protein
MAEFRARNGKDFASLIQEKARREGLKKQRQTFDLTQNVDKTAGHKKPGSSKRPGLAHFSAIFGDLPRTV